MPTALLYIRRSEVRSNKPTLSPQRQQDSCTQFAQEKGWQVEIFADAEGHRSGRTEKGRPEWLRLKERIRYAAPGEIAAVVVYALDRSSRSARDFLNFLHLLQDKKTDFVSVTQPFLDTTSAVGRAFVSMLSIWAQLEADMDSERVTADIAYRQQEGLFFGHCPIGYTRQLIDGVRVPMPDDDAPKVVRIWEEYAKGEHSYRSLMRWVNNVLQLPTKTGGTWTHKHIQIMFENWEFYTGWVTRYKKRGGIDRYRGKHPAIVSDELAERVQQMRKEREDVRLRKRRPPKYDYLLSSIVYCADCGTRLRAFPSHGIPKYKHEKRGCTWSIVDAATVEAQVLDLFSGWELPAELEKEMADSFAEMQVQEQLSVDGSKKLRALDARKERALKLFEMGMRDQPWLMQTVAEVEEARRAILPPSKPIFDSRQLGEIVRQFGAAVTDSDASPERVKSLLVTILEKVEVTDQGLKRVIAYRWFRDFFRMTRESLHPQGNSNPNFSHSRKRFDSIMMLAG